jgi:hypothetical protein
MLKHGIPLGIFTLLTAFATPSAAYQAQTTWDERESCGCILREWRAPDQDGRESNGRRAERQGAPIGAAGQ